MAEQRPAPSPSLSGTELRRWYWTRAELAALARTIGVSTAGGKSDLADRLAAALDGRPPSPPTPRRPAPAAPLPEPITRATVLPSGQRCTEQLRRYLRTEIGPSFRFDGAMREFIAAAGHPADGGGTRTVGDVIEHWRSSRTDTTQAAEIGSQFELNRFLRDWHHRNPGGSHTDALAAWREHRARPHF